jgi:hypothetical protein
MIIEFSILNPNEIDNALVEALLCGLYDIQQKYPEHIIVEIVSGLGADEMAQKETKTR